MTTQDRNDTDQGTKGRDGKGKWLSRLKSWVAMSEPSTQALKQHKKTVYKNSGVSFKDPQASAKLHIPATTIPETAIKPASGPDPDDLARKRAHQRRINQQSRSEVLQSSGSRSARSQSMSSSAVSSRQDSESRPSVFVG